jgi:hypothetical protein
MVSETMTDIQRRIRATGSSALLCGAALYAASAWLAGCGSDGNNVTCGKGTKQKGSTCIAEERIVDERMRPRRIARHGGSETGGAGGGAGFLFDGWHRGSGTADSGVTEDVLVFKA